MHNDVREEGKEEYMITTQKIKTFPGSPITIFSAHTWCFVG